MFLGLFYTFSFLTVNLVLNACLVLLWAVSQLLKNHVDQLLTVKCLNQSQGQVGTFRIKELSLLNFSWLFVIEVHIV